jgi:hypothetical protein
MGSYSINSIQRLIRTQLDEATITAAQTVRRAISMDEVIAFASMNAQLTQPKFGLGIA